MIFGVMGGSVASVTTGTDDLWDELCWTVDQCRRHVHMLGVRTSVWTTETRCICKTFSNAESHRMDGPEGRVECKSNLMLQMLRTQLCRWKDD